MLIHPAREQVEAAAAGSSGKAAARKVADERAFQAQINHTLAKAAESQLDYIEKQAVITQKFRLQVTDL